LTRELLETLQMMVQHFTKTPSTLADSKARGKAHEVIAKAYEQIGYTASTQSTATQPAQTQVALSRAEIARIAGSCMESGRYAMFMAYIDAALAKETNNG
jgi:hypothetical protein